MSSGRARSGEAAGPAAGGGIALGPAGCGRNGEGREAAALPRSCGEASERSPGPGRCWGEQGRFPPGFPQRRPPRRHFPEASPLHHLFQAAAEAAPARPYRSAEPRSILWARPPPSQGGGDGADPA